MNLYTQIKEDLEKRLELLNNVNLDGLIPFTKMKNMDICLTKVLNHISIGSNIRVVGDYDADGILATSIVVSFFEDHPNLPNIDYFIPNRFEHGYGVSPLIVEKCFDDNINLIITVDNGISAVSAIDKANELGIDVIITDHHTPPKQIPNIETIIDPLLDDQLEFNHISGATVAWAFCSALNDKLETQINMYKYLDFAAITVLSDVIPLYNVNRALLQHGFAKIKENKRVVYSKIFSKSNRDNMTSTNIGFNLVPKINATGRLANASLGVKLFLEKDSREVDSILNEINLINEDRKEITHEHLDLVLAQAAEQNEKYNVIIVTNPKLHEGVVGIIASRIVEMYNKPAIVLGEHNGELKGSARSLGKISIYELLNNNNHLLLKFGGHAGAAGLGMIKANLEELRINISNEMSEIFTKDDYKNDLFAYETNSLDKLDMNMANLLNTFEPYGEKFDRPKFIIKGKILEVKKVSKNVHYLCVVRDRLFGKKDVWFYNFNEDMDEYINKQTDFLIDCSISFWQGNKSIMLSGKIHK